MEKKQAFEEQRAILQRQIDEKHEELRQARLQIEQEKEMVNEIIHKINMEDQEYTKFFLHLPYS